VRAGTFVQSGAALTFCPRTRERAAGYNGESTGVHENFAEIFTKFRAKIFARKKNRKLTLKFGRKRPRNRGCGCGSGRGIDGGRAGVLRFCDDGEKKRLTTEG
jgi:hypothetical protein